MNLNAKSKPELIKIYEDLNIPLPDGKFTKQDLIFGLDDYEITGEKVKSFEAKKKTEDDYVDPGPQVGDRVVVCMDRKNFSFIYKTHKFTKDRKYVVMSREDADELLKTESGFHKASREEIENYYK